VRPTPAEPKPKAPARKSTRASSGGSLAEKFAADAKRTAERLAAEAKARDEATKQARAEAEAERAGATGTSRDEED
jgi:flagellar hook-associated protein FlgK